jgi:hypothetical protein
MKLTKTRKKLTTSFLQKHWYEEERNESHRAYIKKQLKEI